MSKNFRMQLEKVFDALGEIVAFLAVIFWAAVILNANFGFLSKLPSIVTVICVYGQYWSGLLLIAITGLECVIKRNIIIRIIFYILLAVIIIFTFFPGTYDMLIAMVPVK